MLLFVSCGGGINGERDDGEMDGLTDGDLVDPSDQSDHSDQTDQAKNDDPVAVDNATDDFVDESPDLLSDESSDEPVDGSVDADDLLSTDDDAGPLPQTIAGPTITLNDNPLVPLAAKGTLKTNIPTRLRITIASTEGARVAELPGVATADHSFPVLGLFPGLSNTITVEMKVEGGNYIAAGAPVILDAPALPADFPPLTVLSAQPDAMEPGWTLLNISRSNGNGNTDGVFGCLLAAVDSAGRVGWYYHDTAGDCYDFGLMADGSLMIQFLPRIIMTDMLGNVTAAWHPEKRTPLYDFSVPVAVETFHHAVTEMPSGNLLTLDTDKRTVADWPTSETDPAAAPADATITGDEAVEFSRDGTVLHRYLMLDLLDPYRIGYTSIRMFKQWSHANAVYYDESDDTVVVSLRNQSVVMKIGRADGLIKWMLGPHDNWDAPWASYLLTPVGDPFAWNYYQHAPTILDDGTLLLFDNGAYRAFPYETIYPATDNWSRAVIFDVDPFAMTVSQVWEWGGDTGEKIYSSYLSDADHLPQTGNILITFGGITTDASGTPTDDLLNCAISARIIEVTRGAGPSQKVFDLSIDDPAAALRGWRVYRSARWPMLYPAPQD